MEKSLPSNLPITVIIPVHRHDWRLEKAIESAIPAAEVLIVDTVGLKSLSVFEQLPQLSLIPGIIWNHGRANFAEARNQALTQASHDWVFFLDSDESINQDSWTEIEKLINNPNQDGKLFHVKRKDFFKGKELKWGEVGDSWHIRLGRKEKMQFERPIHERIKVTPETRTSQVALDHYPHQTLGEFWDKISIYSQQEAVHRITSGEEWSAWNMITFPIGKFLLNYFIKLGFLDGWAGLVYAMMMSTHSFMVRVFWYELTHGPQNA